MCDLQAETLRRIMHNKIIDLYRNRRCAEFGPHHHHPHGKIEPGKISHILFFGDTIVLLNREKYSMTDIGNWPAQHSFPLDEIFGLDVPQTPIFD